VVVDQLIQADLLVLVSMYLIYEEIKLFVLNDYLHFDQLNLHKENEQDRILYDIQLSEMIRYN
jgi:hypothetical protein